MKIHVVDFLNVDFNFKCKGTAFTGCFKVYKSETFDGVFHKKPPNNLTRLLNIYTFETIFRVIGHLSYFLKGNRLVFHFLVNVNVV